MKLEKANLGEAVQKQRLGSNTSENKCGKGACKVARLTSGEPSLQKHTVSIHASLRKVQSFMFLFFNVLLIFL